MSGLTLASKEGDEDDEDEEEGVLPGLHSKFNNSGLEFLKSSFLRHVHDILEQGIPDGERNIGDTLKFSWSDLKCPQLEERDPILEIVPGEGMKGSIEVDAFSIDGNWGYCYKKGLFRWSDCGTFHLAFKRLRVNIIMSIKIEGPDNQLKLFIKPGNADVEAEDVEIKMKSQGVMTQGIINVALPSIRSMWRKPAELSRKIEENANNNLKDIVRLLPISYPLQQEVLGTAFHVGNLFQRDFVITDQCCYWELTSVIVPTANLDDYLEKEEARGKETKGKDKDLKGGKSLFPHVRRKQAASVETSGPTPVEDLPPHPFSPANFSIPRYKVTKMTTHPSTKGTENHISYCLSEFTLNTFASSVFDLGLCECLITDWENIPGYLQRYISTLCRKEPSLVRVESKLTERPEVTIETEDMLLTLNGWIIVAADCEANLDNSNGHSTTADEADLDDWSLFHKTEHEVKCRIIPRVDKDFVIKFAFEKIHCSSVFERMVSKTSAPKRGAKQVKDSAKSTMLAIVENMIIVELLPRIYEVGEVGIPLTINEGCLFETTEIVQESRALLISGFMRLKEFGKNVNKDTAESHGNGEDTGWQGEDERGKK